MKYFIALISFFLIFSGCNQGEKNQETAEFVSLSQLSDHPESLTSETIIVKGMVTHVCKHGGQKMFLTNEAKDKKILVRVSQTIPEFDISLEGSTVEVTGKLITSIKKTDENNGNDSEEATENCPEETELKTENQNISGSTRLTYYVEAASFKEVSNEL